MSNPLVELYPHLSLRRDWPPASREPAPDMSEQERNEFWQYWQARDTEPGAPIPDRERPVLSPDGELIPAHELEAAQDHMIAEVERPDDRVRLPNEDALAAENYREWWVTQEKDRHAEVGHEEVERDPWWRGR